MPRSEGPPARSTPPMIGLLALLSTAAAQDADWTLCAVCSEGAEESFENQAIWACGEVEHDAFRWAEFVRTEPAEHSVVFAGVKWERTAERMMKRLEAPETRPPSEYSGPRVVGTLPSGFPVEVAYWAAEDATRKGGHVGVPPPRPPRRPPRSSPRRRKPLQRRRSHGGARSSRCRPSAPTTCSPGSTRRGPRRTTGGLSCSRHMGPRTSTAACGAVATTSARCGSSAPAAPVAHSPPHTPRSRSPLTRAHVSRSSSALTFRPSRTAAAAVLPLPLNGSSTRSPGRV